MEDYMARKTTSRRPAPSSSDSPGQAVIDSAHKIWLAGLGAFERAKSEGPKMFEVLVEQGKGLRAKARDAADQALKTVSQGAGEARGKWDKLEQVFEDRVSKSLSRLGVAGGREVENLSRQVRELNESVRGLMSRGETAAKGGAKRAKGKVKRAAAPRTRKAKSKSKAKPRATRGSRARRA
jgi:poly(hydroxyalkanoate) granule-associated protein